MNIYLHLAYLTASILFVIGIKMLNKTKTARNGNLVSAVGMLIAILATVSQVQSITYIDIFVAFLIGSAIGLIFAYKVKMTQMPEMVAIFNGFGGLASVAVALSDYWLHTQQQSIELSSITVVSIILSIFIGGITFTGSMIAFLKLNGSISGRAIVFKGQNPLNLMLLIIGIILSVLIVMYTSDPSYILLLTILSLVLGVLVVIPIGGADMPVVISLLNSYSGMAACATGFVLNNNVLIIAGALVGASGIVLTDIMCKAMNRSLINVLLGGFGQTSSSVQARKQSGYSD